MRLHFLLLCYVITYCNAFIIPNDLPTILSVIYSNIPPFKLGIDTRLGYGFRLGQHADYQTLIEIGPQLNTNPISNNEAVAKRKSSDAKKYLRPIKQKARKEEPQGVLRTRSPNRCNAFIIPNDLPTVLSIIYSNIPPVKLGIDTRLGYGFRLGPHFDYQTLIEIGPQLNTNPISTNGTVAKRQSNTLKRLYQLNKEGKREPGKAEVPKDGGKGKKVEKTLVGKIEFKKIPGIDDFDKTKNVKNVKSIKSSSESTPTKFVLI